MNNKLKAIGKYIVCLIIVIFLCFQYFGYSSDAVDYQSLQDLKEQYHLNLSDENWRYTLYKKKSFINPKPSYYSINNPFLSFDGYSVSINVTEGNEFFETSLPKMLFKSKRNKLALEKEITHNNVDMIVQVLEIEPDDFVLEYAASYKIIVNYDHYLYHFDFIKSPPISYSKYQIEINEEELKECLDIIDEIFIPN